MDVDSQVSGRVGAAIAGPEEAARAGFRGGHSRSYDLESGLLDSETPTLRILPYFYRNSLLNTEYGNGAYSYREPSYIELAT